MLQISASLACDLPALVAEQCAHMLTWPESEMQRWFSRAARLALEASERDWLVAWAWIAAQRDADEQPEVVGWVTVTEWTVGSETRIQVQGFVADAYRGGGIATALVACLCHDMPKTQLPIAVFSNEFLRIARRFGWCATQYRSVDDGWIAVASVEGGCRGGGTDARGVHADAPEVRGVSLARSEEGPTP